MARLYTDTPFSGTFGNLTVYRVGDKCYARTKSSLDKKRFYKDSAFARSREKALLFGEAARLVKAVYKELPKEVKRHGLFGKLTALAYKGLQEGKSSEELITELKVYCGVEKEITSVKLVKPINRTPFQFDHVNSALSSWCVNNNGRLQKVIASRGSYLPLPCHSTTKKLHWFIPTDG